MFNKKIFSNDIDKMTSPSDRVLGATDDIPSVMNVESSVLEPIIITDTQARFVLENKGILSKDSVLQFQLTCSLPGQGFLPLGSGIYSLIKQATLRIGATRINNLQDLALFKTMTHSYDTPSFRTNVTRLLKGINTTMVNTNVNPGNLASGQFLPAGSNLFAEGFCGPDYQMQLTNDSNTTPCWSIKLAELFPVLYDIELPLFLLNDEVAIDLTFNTQTATDSAKGTGSICCFQTLNAGVAQLGTCTLVKDTCLLYMDTITYANERMEQVAEAVNAKSGMFLDYTDVIQNVAAMPTVPPPPAAAGQPMTIQQKTDQVPLSGFRVKNLFWGYNVLDYSFTTSAGTTNPGNFRFFNPLLGKYALNAYTEDDTWDIRVNDRLIFPQPIKSTTMKVTEAENVYGSPVYLNQALYSFAAETTKGADFPIPATSSLLPDAGVYPHFWGEGRISALRGGLNFSAVNLSHGWGDDNDDTVLIDQKPIEIQHRALPVNQSTNFQRNAHYFAEVVKRFGIMDGKVQVFQQPAVQTSRQ